MGSPRVGSNPTGVDLFDFVIFDSIELREMIAFFSAMHYGGISKGIVSGTCGLVAMTSAQHAEGRQFDPGQVYFGCKHFCLFCH